MPSVGSRQSFLRKVMRSDFSGAPKKWRSACVCNSTCEIDESTLQRGGPNPPLNTQDRPSVTIWTAFFLMMLMAVTAPSECCRRGPVCRRWLRGYRRCKVFAIAA